jgi:hypothetical protein
VIYLTREQSLFATRYAEEPNPHGTGAIKSDLRYEMDLIQRLERPPSAENDAAKRPVMLLRQ